MRFPSCYSVLLLFTCLPLSLKGTGNSFSILDYDEPEQLYNYLNELTRQFPGITSLIKLGLSFEERPIYCLKINKGNKSAGTIVAEFGAHAREWASHTSATHVIHELLHNVTYDEVITRMVWYIIPLLNPDGFKFSKTKEPDWRKNRRINAPDGACRGVDVNRNFPVKWFNDREICDNQYGGKIPSSESETLAIERLFTLIPGGKVDIYISVHTAAQCILLPYAYTREQPPTFKKLYEVAERMKSAMEMVGYPKYTIMQAAEMYVVPGTVFDWAYNRKGVPLVFTLELPFFRDGKVDFKVKKSEMKVIAMQCLAGLVSCAKEMTNPGPTQGGRESKAHPPEVKSKRRTVPINQLNTGNSRQKSFTMIEVVTVLIIYLGNPLDQI